MTVSNTQTRIGYVGDGVTTGFPVPYVFIKSTDIDVYADGVLLGSGYSVTGGNGASGAVEFLVAPAVGIEIAIVRDTDLLQETDIPPNDPFPADAVERMSDKLTLIAQEQSADLARALKLPPYATIPALELPYPLTPLYYWRNNAAGDGIEFVDLSAGSDATALAAALAAPGGAGMVGILDAAGKISATTVEGALAELAVSIQTNNRNSADAGGTADAITASFTPAITAVTHGQVFFVRAAAANATTTPTFTPNSGTVTPWTIVKLNNQALGVGDIPGAGARIILVADTTLSRFVLINPAQQRPLQYQDEGSNLGATGTVDTVNFVGPTLVASRAGNTVTVTGSAATLGSPISASGQVNMDYTGLPAGLRRIVGTISGISTNGTNQVVLRVGNSSAGFVTSGYAAEGHAASTAVNGALETTGFALADSASAASVRHGHFTLTMVDASTNTWTCSFMVAQSDTARAMFGGGTITLTGPLDRVRLTSFGGTDTFDAGKFNILYD